VTFILIDAEGHSKLLLGVLPATRVHNGYSSYANDICDLVTCLQHVDWRIDA
jgi:hypothetical protein